MTRPDPGKDYWNSSDVAAWLGVEVSTVSAYRAREQMPGPDLTAGKRTHLWKPATIITWHKNRPRVGGAEWCEVHQHWKWCAHNGGCDCDQVPNGWHAPHDQNSS